jgi:hypothetical protein
LRYTTGFVTYIAFTVLFEYHVFLLVADGGKGFSLVARGSDCDIASLCVLPSKDELASNITVSPCEPVACVGTPTSISSAAPNSGVDLVADIDAGAPVVGASESLHVGGAEPPCAVLATSPVKTAGSRLGLERVWKPLTNMFVSKTDGS